MGVIEKYFVDPFWARESYNIVNTLTYAILGLAIAYTLYLFLKKEKIKFDSKLIISFVPFILLGSTIRVLVDINEKGFSSFYTYNYFTVTPGIWVAMTLLAFLSVILSKKINKPLAAPAIGWVLFLIHLTFILSFTRYIFYGLLTLLLVLIVGLLIHIYFRKKELRKIAYLPVISHSLDGAATYVGINIWNNFEDSCTKFMQCYSEQHVLSGAIGKIIGNENAYFGGYFIFFLIKVLFLLFVTIYVEKKMKDETRDFVIFLLIVFGLGPGMRSLLRLIVGV